MGWVNLKMTAITLISQGNDNYYLYVAIIVLFILAGVYLLIGLEMCGWA